MVEETSKLTTIILNNGSIEEESLPLDRIAVQEGGPIRWLPLRNPSAKLLEELSRRLSLHPLTVEDLLSPTDNDKLEEYPNYLFGSIRRARLDSETVLDSDPLMFIFFPNLLVTVAYGESPALLDAIHRQLDVGVVDALPRAARRRYDVGYVLFLVFREVVATYRAVANRLTEEIDVVEDEVQELQPAECATALTTLRRALVSLRRNAATFRLVVNQLEREDDRFLPDDFDPFLRDLADQLSELMQLCESERDVVTSLQELNMAYHNTRMNETMKVLTIIATIFMPLSFIAGIYGMNFRHMPELAVPWAYPAVLGVMLLVAGGFVFYFKRKGWF